ncbi:MAG TPA: type II toxin-antitoxin system VapC family toxin [Solirubrobacteraceae bacterium]|nr:type II toxin-antitoxin system VapC family toxin [Solirubrobacteraceae bacterium]
MIVLDTHAWLWWLTAPERLSTQAQEAIERAPSVGISTLSAWEVAMLVVRGRISLDRDVRLWVGQALADPRVESIAPSADVAVAAGLLDTRTFPGDPVDRLIYATARSTGATLVTRDEAIRAFDPASTLW